MINDIITGLISFLSSLYTNLGLHTAFSGLLDLLDDFQQYQTLFNEYLSGVYFLFGKGLVIYMVGAFLTILLVRVVFAVINIVGQFIP